MLFTAATDLNMSIVSMQAEAMDKLLKLNSWLASKLIRPFSCKPYFASRLNNLIKPSFDLVFI